MLTNPGPVTRLTGALLQNEFDTFGRFNDVHRMLRASFFTDLVFDCVTIRFDWLQCAHLQVTFISRNFLNATSHERKNMKVHVLVHFCSNRIYVNVTTDVVSSNRMPGSYEIHRRLYRDKYLPSGRILYASITRKDKRKDGLSHTSSDTHLSQQLYIR